MDHRAGDGGGSCAEADNSVSAVRDHTTIRRDTDRSCDSDGFAAGPLVAAAVAGSGFTAQRVLAQQLRHSTPARLPSCSLARPALSKMPWTSRSGEGTGCSNFESVAVGNRMAVSNRALSSAAASMHGRVAAESCPAGKETHSPLAESRAAGSSPADKKAAYSRNLGRPLLNKK